MGTIIGIDLLFMPWNTLDNTNFLSLSVNTGNEFSTLVADPVAYGGSAIATVLNLWFANDLDNIPGLYGVTSDIGRRDIAIGSIAVLNYHGGIGRLDTIAHEIGHSLGLGHFDYGAGGANNLMTQGSDRAVPSSINDINPDGLQLDQLTADQIGVARRSPFVVLDPGTFALLALGLIPISLVARKPRA